jgi:hypothetical protein
MVQIFVAPPGRAPEFIWFKGVSIEDGHHVPHAKLLPRSRLQELDIHPVGVLFVFELSEVEVLCTKDQSEEILERIVDRRLSAVTADENPGDIQFRGFQPPSAPNRVGFSASRSIQAKESRQKG